MNTTSTQNSREWTAGSIVLGWVAVVALALVLLHWINTGEVEVGRVVKTRYTRQHDPAMYWFTLGVDAVVLLIATYRVATARWIESPPKKKDLTPDLTPQDWMGNPLKPK